MKTNQKRITWKKIGSILLVVSFAEDIFLAGGAVVYYFFG